MLDSKSIQTVIHSKVDCFTTASRWTVWPTRFYMNSVGFSSVYFSVVEISRWQSSANMHAQPQKVTDPVLAQSPAAWILQQFSTCLQFFREIFKQTIAAKGRKLSSILTTQSVARTATIDWNTVVVDTVLLQPYGDLRMPKSMYTSSRRSHIMIVCRPKNTKYTRRLLEEKFVENYV